MSKQEATNKPKLAVSYIRVSTSKQGHSGLGLEAQRASVQAFAQANGYEIVQEFLEIQSGTDDSRPMLKQARIQAKRRGACLVLAKLDRLARSVRFIAEIMDAKVDFRVADLPHADRTMLQFMAVIGENESRACSERTKSALKAAKARGKLLGASNPASRNLPENAHVRGGQSMQNQAREAYSNILPEITSLKAQGLTLRSIANALNTKGTLTRNGKDWNACQVSRALQYQGG